MATPHSVPSRERLVVPKGCLKLHVRWTPSRPRDKTTPAKDGSGRGVARSLSGDMMKVSISEIKKPLSLLFLLLAGANVFAEERADPAHQACLESCRISAIQLEAKEAKLPPQRIKVSQTRLLGSGAGLFLCSTFVESPNTADNVHWEIVGEFNYKSGTCKTALSRRFEAP